jgi:hypothetical protein
MSVISNLLSALPGKKSTVRNADLDIGITFGLWENYSRWLDIDQQLQYWYSTDSLTTSNVILKICLDDIVIVDQPIKKFETLKINHVLDDVRQNDHILEFEFTNLNALPVRDDTGVFVSGMFKIDYVRLQSIDVVPCLDDVMFGVDGTTKLTFSTPVYSWLVANRAKILPTFPSGY